MPCAICGNEFDFIKKDYKYIKKPVGLTITASLFICRGNSHHYYMGIDTMTLEETRKMQSDRRKELRKERGDDLPYNSEVSKPYSKRTDLGEPTEQEKRIADKTKGKTLQELKDMMMN